MVGVAQGLLLASVPVLIGLGAYGVRHRPRSGAAAFAVYALGSAIWAAGALGATVVDGVAVSILWTRFQYVGIVSVPVAWLVLTARYSGMDDVISRRRIAALGVTSAAFLLVMWSNDHHHQFYRTIIAPASTLAGYDVVHGPAFYMLTAYAYALILWGCALLVRMLTHGQRVYRRQAAATLIAAIAPLASNVAYLTGLTQSDLTAVAFTVSALAIGWAMHRFEFMDLTPIARETVVENIRDGVLVLDDDDRIVDANPTACALLGLDDSGRLVGVHATDALDSPYDALLSAFSTTDRGSDLLTFDTPDGKRFVDVTLRPYEDASGRDRGRLFYLHDVTERERRERELQRQNEQLERFASLVSHDLRNPLNVAEGYVEHVQSSGDFELLEEVEVSHDRMRDIIDDVLDLARHGRTVTDVAPVEVRAVSERAWESVDTADASLSVTATSTVVADESRLRQLLENLFRNAVQHGGDDVTVTVGDCDDGFYVADDGPGIPVDRREDVLDDGYTTHDDGTGLGLSIVTSIADAHEWSVAVTESETGGVRFEFTGTTPARDDAPAELAAD